jgi:hypothetical protein
LTLCVYGASYTDAWKINDSGQVVGRYGTPDQGYLYENGSFSAVMPQNYSWAYGINNSGDIVGLYVDMYMRDHGFLKTGNTFISIDYPGNTGITAVYDINNYGSIVGWYTDPTAGERGFLATPVPIPGAVWLLGSGLIGLVGLKSIRRFPSHPIG